MSDSKPKQVGTIFKLILVLGIYKNNITLYVGIGITVAMLAAGAAILYVWCRYNAVRPAYSAARAGLF